MQLLQLQQTPQLVGYDVTEHALDPLAQYLAWAAEIGGSPTGTDFPDIEGDDSASTIEIAVPFWPNSQINVAMIATEGGIGLFRYAPTSVQARSWPFDGASRFYWTRSLPTLTVSYHPEFSDLQLYNTRITSAGGTTLVFGQHSNWNNRYSERYDVAAKIQAGRIEIVGQAFDRQTIICLLEATEPGIIDNDGHIISTTRIETQPTNSIRKITVSLQQAVVYVIAGVAKFTDGAIAEMVRLWRRSDANLTAELVPNPETGAYRCELYSSIPHDVAIFRAGYRPLMHGPVMPVETE